MRIWVDVTNSPHVVVLRPVIDTVYPLDRTAEAIDHIGEGRARGKVVVVP